MKNFVRKTILLFSFLILILSCTKDIGLKTEVEFSLIEEHKAEGNINEDLSTTITVVPEEELEEFSYSYSYSVTKGEGHFRDREGTIFPQKENIALHPFTASLMYVGSKKGEHIVKVTATDNYGFTEEVEIDYMLTEVSVVWTATSAVKRLELGNSAPITVTLESINDNGEADYKSRYGIVSGSGILTELPGENGIILDEFNSILPGTYQFNFTPDALGTMELSFDLRDENGEEFNATVNFEVLEEIVDTVAPEISLLGENPLAIVRDSTFEDPGATASDDVDGDISADIVIDASGVDNSVVGTYQITYNVSDSAGNAAVEKTRIVEVIEGDTPQNDTNAILAFAVPGQNAASTINDTVHTIAVNVPFGTDVMVAPTVLTVSPNATITPSRTEQRNFENPVTYMVTAENGDVQQWTVTVNIAKSNEKSIEEFEIDGVQGDFSGTDISITLPPGTDSSTLVPIINFTGASLSPQSGSPVDLTNPVVYTVSAEDGSTSEYTITVTVEKSSEKDITAFRIAGVAGAFSGNNIMLTLPAGTDASSLSPDIEFTGISLSPSSGSTVDFTNPVIYTVTAEDDSTKAYNVTVTVEESDEKEITGFVVEGVSGIFSGTDITLTLPSGNDEKSLSPNIVHTGESINPASGISRDFTNPVIYTVTAENGTQQTYSVTITVENDQPVASASANPTMAALNQDINFTGSLSTDDIGIVGYAWDFGDGNTSNSTNPVHSYTSHGTYVVRLTVTDDGGLTDTVTLDIDVPNQAPTAVGSASHMTALINQNITFNGSLSTDDLGISSYSWDFGDGNSSSSPNPVYSYGAHGKYSVTLVVTDNQGLNDAVMFEIDIPNQPPTAVASSDINSGQSEITVNFMGNSSTDDVGITNYAWDFGDGAGSNLANPVHTFDCVGTYDVTLTVTDTGGLDDSEIIQITVTPATAISFDLTTGILHGPPGTEINASLIINGSGSSSLNVGGTSLFVCNSGSAPPCPYPSSETKSTVIPACGKIKITGHHNSPDASSYSRVIITGVGNIRMEQGSGIPR